MSKEILDELEQYAQPVRDFYDEEVYLLTQFPELTQKYSVGLVVGRFQPLHRGHLYLMRQTLQVAERIVIGIGSSNIVNDDNPFSVKQRQELLRRALERETDIHKRVRDIISIPDYPEDDDAWLKETLRQAGEVGVVVGNNDWVKRIFKAAGYSVVEIPFLQRGVYKGAAIRQRLREENKL